MLTNFLYGAFMRWRRGHPGRRHHLHRPVISIGNLAVGGRAKTPMAELVARILLAAGERPAILSRGYARERRVDAPVVVRDAQGLRAALAESGDEPLMLAEALDGAIVVVAADRARAGAAAETLGATVHVLDDGFQHFRVARDLDIVMLHPRDLADAVLPAGRLREPLGALGAADAVILIDGTHDERMAASMHIAEVSNAFVFGAGRRVEPPPPGLAGARAFLVSGIASASELAPSMTAAGWTIAGERAYRDHHAYGARDVDDIIAAARAAGAALVLTTMKDAVRLRDRWRGDLPLVAARMTLDIDGTFEPWLMSRVESARERLTGAVRRAREDGVRRAS